MNNSTGACQHTHVFASPIYVPALFVFARGIRQPNYAEANVFASAIYFPGVLCIRQKQLVSGVPGGNVGSA
jgi:hypothetical protein